MYSIPFRYYDPVKKEMDYYINNSNSPTSKKILIFGNRGTGKSLYCKIILKSNPYSNIMHYAHTHAIKEIIRGGINPSRAVIHENIVELNRTIPIKASGIRLDILICDNLSGSQLFFVFPDITRFSIPNYTNIIATVDRPLSFFNQESIKESFSDYLIFDFNPKY